jgi:thermitase
MAFEAISEVLYMPQSQIKVLLLALGLCLAACNGEVVPPPTDPKPTAPVPTPVIVPDSEAHYSLTVKIKSHDTIQSLEGQYGGKVVVWRPDQEFAVLALNKSNGDKLAQSGNKEVTLETNKNVFSGSGQLATMGGVSIWAGGVSLWAGGVSIWAGGTYQPVPQNDSKWRKLNLQQAQALATNLGDGVKVAIIDTGVDLKHPAFQGAFVPDSEMWDYVGNDAVPQEEGELGVTLGYGHGTSVAGIVLQIAPKAKILPLRVLGSDGGGDVLNVAAAINRALDEGAKIINLSLGSLENSQAVSDAINAATAKGVFVISSGGNSGDQHITFPANQNGFDLTTTDLYSLSVGSVDDMDHKSGFSSYGTTLELSAPGEQVFGPVPENHLGAWSGTSMAAPMVSGSLALALSEPLKGEITPAELTKKLKNRSVNIYRQNQNSAYNNLLGAGRLDIYDFLSTVML